MLVTGCASSPSSVSSAGAPAISARLLSWEELKSAFGKNYETDPYMPYKGIFSGAKEEFIVLKIEVSMPKNGTVSVFCSASGPDGAAVAVQKDIREMENYWYPIGGKTEVNIETRMSMLRRSYMRSNPYAAKAGKSSFIIVLIGKNPLPRPAKVDVQVMAAGLESASFSFDLN
jgi:hypothetical protein